MSFYMFFVFFFWDKLLHLIMFCAVYILYNIIPKIHIQNPSVLCVISHKNCRFWLFSLIFNRTWSKPVLAGCLFLGQKLDWTGLTNTRWCLLKALDHRNDGHIQVTLFLFTISFHHPNHHHNIWGFSETWCVLSLQRYVFFFLKKDTLLMFILKWTTPSNRLVWWHEKGLNAPNNGLCCRLDTGDRRRGQDGAGQGGRAQESRRVCVSSPGISFGLYFIRKITLCPGQLWVALRSFRGIRLGLKIW